jgi:uncharacterized DUF497 family protein
MYDFRWNEWNVDHIARHGVSPEEAEFVITHMRSPFPRRADNDKRIAWGQTAGGRYLQVAYLLDPDGTVYVIHARDLTDGQKRQLRRARR